MKAAANPCREVGYEEGLGMEYTSITHYDRVDGGYNVQSDFYRVSDWSEQMDRNALGVKDAKWSLLIEVRTGDVLYRYGRGRN